MLHKEGFISFPLTAEGRRKTDALVGSITGRYFGKDIYESAELKSVAYLYFLIKDHPFTDGNKRTASLTFETICEINGLEPNYNDFTLDELVVFLEKVQEQNHHDVIKKVSEILFEVT